MTEPMHEVVVDGLVYGFRDRETGERFRRAVEGERRSVEEEVFVPWRDLPATFLLDWPNPP